MDLSNDLKENEKRLVQMNKDVASVALKKHEPIFRHYVVTMI